MWRACHARCGAVVPTRQSRHLSVDVGQSGCRGSPRPLLYYSTTLLLYTSTPLRPRSPDPRTPHPAPRSPPGAPLDAWLASVSPAQRGACWRPCGPAAPDCCSFLSSRFSPSTVSPDSRSHLIAAKLQICAKFLTVPPPNCQSKCHRRLTYKLCYQSCTGA